MRQILITCCEAASYLTPGIKTKHSPNWFFKETKILTTKFSFLSLFVFFSDVEQYLAYDFHLLHQPHMYIHVYINRHIQLG